MTPPEIITMIEAMIEDGCLGAATDYAQDCGIPFPDGELLSCICTTGTAGVLYVPTSAQPVGEITIHRPIGGSAVVLGDRTPYDYRPHVKDAKAVRIPYYGIRYRNGVLEYLLRQTRMLVNGSISADTRSRWGLPCHWSTRPPEWVFMDENRRPEPAPVE